MKDIKNSFMKILLFHKIESGKLERNELLTKLFEECKLNLGYEIFINKSIEFARSLKSMDKTTPENSFLDSNLSTLLSEYSDHLSSCIDTNGYIKFDRIFNLNSSDNDASKQAILPIKLEICSGFGEWAMDQVDLLFCFILLIIFSFFFHFLHFFSFLSIPKRF